MCFSIQSKGGALVQLLELTPFARAEFDLSYETTADPIEKARRLVIRSYMGFGSNAHATAKTGRAQTGFRSNSSRSGTTPAADWANYPTALRTIIERLTGVVIESRDASEVMAAHDGAQTLHYVDPPYPLELRNPGNPHDRKHMYRHELTSSDHDELLTFLPTLEGAVVLSGYPSERYDDALSGWDRFECDAHADGARPRTEVVWINEACADRLKVGTLFERAG